MVPMEIPIVCWSTVPPNTKKYAVCEEVQHTDNGLVIIFIVKTGFIYNKLIAQMYTGDYHFCEKRHLSHNNNKIIQETHKYNV